MPPDTILLVVQLNALLSSLSLPFTLQSPTDLTPSLLLAILEAILGVRLPIEQDADLPTQTSEAKRTRHIQTIKVFLGVLETDVLKADVGLSKIDPRLLADGAWDEVVYISEILCWIGRETGLIPSHTLSKGKGKEKEDGSLQRAMGASPPQSPMQQTQQPPSPSSTITFLPPFSSPNLESDYTSTFASLLFTEADTDTTALASSPPTAGPSTPTRNHPTPHTYSHYPQPPLLLPIDPDNSSFRIQSPPVRSTGYISLVDHDTEISTFLSHSLSLSSPSITPSLSSPPHTPHRGNITQPPRRTLPQDWLDLISRSPEYDPRRTLQLLQERTRLMEELLKLRMSNKSA